MKLHYLIVLLIFVSCGTKTDDVLLSEVNRNVESSHAILNQIAKSNDSLNVALSLLDAEIGKLLLLSKDVENSGACAVTGNCYFEKLFGELSLEQLDRLLLSPRLGKEETEMVIRQNELFALNELVFQNSGVDVKLFSVHEKAGE
jgi:hypothetical protein